jgi:cytochrome c553
LQLPVKLAVLASIFSLVTHDAATAGAAIADTAKADTARAKAYGQHLSGECTSCHRADGVDNGVPSITGWPADDFVTTMKFYSSGARENPVMKSVAGSLDDAQIAALAAYFGSLDRPAKKK